MAHQKTSLVSKRTADGLKKEDVKGFFNNLRMGYQIYAEILQRNVQMIKQKR
ncbi:hypothetical protein DPMN_045240 [Dreissena polymorpha]|uniref:Uncharacterized protein n=1 Tax=Dreissena polymorpha TaxID=45954 RepID=A0A9D4D4I0_DREPO|nr:hypothetical protein DPMN_045240 [Dreissena polymorpha]